VSLNITTQAKVCGFPWEAICILLNILLLLAAAAARTAAAVLAVLYPAQPKFLPIKPFPLPLALAVLA
jgi:hypothetical protein